MNPTPITVTLHGNPLPVVGPLPTVGQPAPDCVLIDPELNDVRLSDVTSDRVAVIASVPSLDTPVCDTETRRFNREATGLDENVVLVAVSMDLPFAQARWRGAAGVDRVRVLSDHRDAAFGRAFGVLIPPLRLLARAVFVVDSRGVIRHAQLVPEIAHEPDYDVVLETVRALV